MLKSSLRVGLGTDGAASNHDLSMWEEMDTAAKLHKLVTMSPTVVTAQQALEMATIGERARCTWSARSARSKPASGPTWIVAI